MTITVVLQGASNDKTALQAAVRMAARDRASVRVVLGAKVAPGDFEKHLDFALWDVRERLRLEAPPVHVEARLERLSVALEEVPSGSARS